MHWNWNWQTKLPKQQINLDMANQIATETKIVIFANHIKLSNRYGEPIWQITIAFALPNW
jgi:hypothetical protein